MHTADSLRSTFLSVFDNAEPRITTVLGILNEYEPAAHVYLCYYSNEILLSVVLLSTTHDTAEHSILTTLSETFQRITVDQLTNTKIKQNYETFLLASNCRLIISWV